MFLLGMLLIITAVVCALVAQGSARRLRQLSGAATLTIGNVQKQREAAVRAAGPGRFRMMAEIRGTIQPGPDGPLRSEIGDVECVWHAHALVDASVLGDSADRPIRAGAAVPMTFSSDHAFYLDDGTGRVLVRPLVTSKAPGQIQVTTLPDVVERVTGPVGDGDSSSSSSGETRGIEWVIRPGQVVYVCGELSDENGELVMDRAAGGAYTMSRHSRLSELDKKWQSQRRLLRVAIGTGVGGVLLFAAGFLL